MSGNIDSIGIRLKDARERTGFTQDQVARLIGVKRWEMTCYEAGDREISLGKLERLATLYGYSVDYFLKTDGVDSGEIAISLANDLSDEELEIVVWARGLVSDMAALDDVLKERGN
ncbi:MAG: helix-turn-helix domain-containing protein [Bacillota bacterium]